MSSAWIHQESHQLRELGPDKASWYVGWLEPDGRRRDKSFGPGKEGRKLAERFRRKVEAELMTGTYAMNDRKLWPDFRREYSDKIVSGLSARSRPEVEVALGHFERIVRPVRVFAICTAHVDDFIAKRRKERGKKKGDLVSPATVNKDLRHVKAALGVAVEWGYLKQLPRFRMEREPVELPTFVTGEHFFAIYGACDRARRPSGQPYSPGDWWRALLMFAYMTGWRISEILALRREDVDLAAGTAITRARDNKPKRDDLIKLHPVVVEHLKRIPGFTPLVFHWPQNRLILQRWFHRVQRQASISLPCQKQHEHTETCGLYGFHDLRRAFATVNAGVVSADELQKLMRHQSYQTTQLYINMASRLDEAVSKLRVPAVPPIPQSGTVG